MRLSDAIGCLRASTVQICVDVQPTPETMKSSILGTGFFVNADGWVVTAKHVIDAALEEMKALPNGRLRISFAGPNYDGREMQIRAAFVGRSGEIVATEPDQDLALIRLPDSIFSMFGGIRVGPEEIAGSDPTPVVLETARPKEGRSIAVSGYPLQEPNLVTNAGVVASSWASERLEGKDPDRYLADMTANPGNSGGAVYLTEKATVIGVCVAGRLVPIQGGAGYQTANLTVVVPAKALAEFLDAQGVAWNQPKPGAPQAPRKSKRKKRR